MKSRNMLKGLIAGVILFVICSLVIILNGNSYTIKMKNTYGAVSSEDVNISIEHENIAKLSNIVVDKDTVSISFDAISKGKTYFSVIISGEEVGSLYCIFVHNFNIITLNEFLGDCSYSWIIPLSLTILMGYISFLLIKSFLQNYKKDMYQYKNIAYIGLIIIMVASTISQASHIANYGGLIHTVYDILKTFSLAILIFPLALVVSFLVIISNVVLIKKEGFNVKNTLGIILGISLCFFTVLPEIMYLLLYDSPIIDVHNLNGYGVYVYEFIEAIIYIGVSYTECILLGTIILSIKVGRHIPSFDKDAIVILGCQVKKDGSLTNLLKGRVNRAIEFGKLQKDNTGKELLYIPSGGKGNDEVVSEAQAMKNYLISQGIDENRILMEDNSKNTAENIEFSNKLICERTSNPKVAFSTTNYHVFRAGNLASTLGYKYEGIGAKTKNYFWINAFIREFVATMINEKKKHMLVTFCIIVATIVLTILEYLNNNIQFI